MRFTPFCGARYCQAFVAHTLNPYSQDSQNYLGESLLPLQCLASYFAGCATAQLSLHGACPNSLRSMAQIRVPEIVGGSRRTLKIIPCIRPCIVLIAVEDPRGGQGLGTCSELAVATSPFASQHTGALAKTGAMTQCLWLSVSAHPSVHLPFIWAHLSPNACWRVLVYACKHACHCSDVPESVLNKLLYEQVLKCFLLDDRSCLAAAFAAPTDPQQP